MKWIKLFEEFQMGDLNFMSPEEIQDLFFEECEKRTPDLELIKVILDNGLVDVNAKWDGKTPLHVAVRGGNIALAEYLISAGADVNTKNRYGDSPLHEAVERNNIDLVEYLISAGADVNAKNKDGDTPLHFAIGRNNIAIVKLLISAGTDVNAKDKWGRSSLHRAVREDNVKMQALLKKHGAVL